MDDKNQKNANVENVSTSKVSLEEEKKQSKLLTFGKFITCLVSLACNIGTVIAAFYAIAGAKEVINNKNEQTQVVIEPRDGDIIVKDGDDYKLLQLITNQDIVFPTKVQEKKIKPNDSNKEMRRDINNEKKENWDDKNSFSYTINSFSINSNKVINLLENIEGINVYCDFYDEQNITTIAKIENDSYFTFNFIDNSKKKDLTLSLTNVNSKYEYVTSELNNGIEWVKIRVEIIYKIGEQKITDIITSDWIPTDADI